MSVLTVTCNELLLTYLLNVIMIGLLEKFRVVHWLGLLLLLLLLLFCYFVTQLVVKRISIK